MPDGTLGLDTFSKEENTVSTRVTSMIQDPIEFYNVDEVQYSLEYIEIDHKIHEIQDIIDDETLERNPNLARDLANEKRVLNYYIHENFFVVIDEEGVLEL